ncbi:MAG: ribonuclease J [Acidobacteriia bacterium]|nr:ribonuclease J [Terriglobia bacterium]
MPSPPRIEIVPLGGLGEFGMNLMLYRHGQDCIVVDAGMMFPGAEHLGVDVVIPNLDYLDVCGTIHGVLLTHGHEDHTGALPYLLARREVPVHAAPFTLGLVRARLSEHDLAVRGLLRPLPTDGTKLTLGPFAIETLPVAHSIPQAAMLVIRTPVGTVVHTADFKLDPTPMDGVGADLSVLARLGDEGVLALLSDSTNADRPGFTPGERTVVPVLDSLLASARARVFVTSFASNIERLQQVTALAGRHGRKVALLGASMLGHSDVAERLGLLKIPAGLRVDAETAMNLPRERALILATGSQGEPMSALARIAVDEHRDARVEEGDLVIHSARTIPGNEKSIGRMINHLLRRGADVVTQAEAPVHVSGHPAREELKLLLRLLRPKFLIPIHGEYRQLREHARVGREAGLASDAVIVADSGDLIALTENECRIVDRVPVGQVFIDDALEEVDLSVLRDRRRIAGDGIVVTVVAVDRVSGGVNGTPEIISRGFLPEGGEETVLEEARHVVSLSLAEATPEERADEGLLKARIATDLKRFLRRRTQRRPLIVPVLVEL